MAEGTIKTVVGIGFGFIRTADGTDLFFQLSGVSSGSFNDLREGQRVTYTEGRSPKGLIAENVRRA